MLTILIVYQSCKRPFFRQNLIRTVEPDGLLHGVYMRLARAEVQRGSRKRIQTMFAQELTNAGHVRRFEIRSQGADGWEMRVEEDSAVVRRQQYTDWHRVERAVARVAMEVAELQDAGWTLRTATP
jgi:hypothetical protein